MTTVTPAWPYVAECRNHALVLAGLRAAEREQERNARRGGLVDAAPVCRSRVGLLEEDGGEHHHGLEAVSTTAAAERRSSCWRRVHIEHGALLPVGFPMCDTPRDIRVAGSLDARERTCKRKRGIRQRHAGELKAGGSRLAGLRVHGARAGLRERAERAGCTQSVEKLTSSHRSSTGPTCHGRRTPRSR
jgi:hypothetical protein